ncbi:hypothetical protein MMC12_007556 [Toensbergia leucococca]|nr:hypothetical protein [Toensbergia leucococca]
MANSDNPRSKAGQEAGRDIESMSSLTSTAVESSAPTFQAVNNDDSKVDDGLKSAAGTTNKKFNVTPKKRGSDAEGTEFATPTKKQATPKDKVAPKIEAATDSEATEEESSPGSKIPTTPEVQKATTAPETPKGRRTPAKGKAYGSPADNDNANTPARKRQAPKTPVVTGRNIPSSWDDADAADKMLVTMKENGSDWPTIRKAWEEETGHKTAGSTLPNRYARIKSNMMRLKEGEFAILLAAKKEVERDFETRKWTEIATEMEEKGTEKYPTSFLIKTYKEHRANMEE